MAATYELLLRQGCAALHQVLVSADGWELYTRDGDVVIGEIANDLASCGWEEQLQVVASDYKRFAQRQVVPIQSGQTLQEAISDAIYAALCADLADYATRLRRLQTELAARAEHGEPAE